MDPMDESDFGAGATPLDQDSFLGLGFGAAPGLSAVKTSTAVPDSLSRGAPVPAEQVPADFEGAGSADACDFPEFPAFSEFPEAGGAPSGVGRFNELVGIVPLETAGSEFDFCEYDGSVLDACGTLYDTRDGPDTWVPPPSPPLGVGTPAARVGAENLYNPRPIRAVDYGAKDWWKRPPGRGFTNSRAAGVRKVRGRQSAAAAAPVPAAVQTIETGAAGPEGGSRGTAAGEAAGGDNGVSGAEIVTGAAFGPDRGVVGSGGRAAGGDNGASDAVRESEEGAAGPAATTAAKGAKPKRRLEDTSFEDTKSEESAPPRRAKASRQEGPETPIQGEGSCCKTLLLLTLRLQLGLAGGKNRVGICIFWHLCLAAGL